MLPRTKTPPVLPPITSTEVVEELKLAWPGRMMEHRSAGEGTAFADPDRLAQVVTNLGTNALTYGQPDRPVLVTSTIDPNGLQTTTAYDDLGRVTVTADIAPGAPLKVDKFLAYGWSSVRSLPSVRDQVDAALAAARK